MAEAHPQRKKIKLAREATEVLDPSKCHVSGEGLQEAVVEETSSVILEAVSFKGESYVEQIDSLECKLVSGITGTIVRGRVERKETNQYEITYQPTIKGGSQLHIRIDGQHVKGSPFHVAVKSSVEKLGTPLLTIDGVKRPCGVVVNEKGEVLVTEMECVSVFTPNGKKIRSFGSYGFGHGELNRADGITVDDEGNILVACSGNHCVQKFTSGGQFLAELRTDGSGQKQFYVPNDIAFNAINKKIYVVDLKDRVVLLNSDLTYSSTFGKKGSRKGQFKQPRGVCCDSVGNVYVADRFNHRVQVFTTDGRYLRMFRRQGKSFPEQLCPSGISIDAEKGVVYVSEWGEFINHEDRVSVFTTGGDFVTEFGSSGNKPGQFDRPSKSAVDREWSSVCV